MRLWLCIIVTLFFAPTLANGAESFWVLQGTVARIVEDVPSAKNFPGRELNPDPNRKSNFFGGVPAEVVYEEGIYVGYRYYKNLISQLSINLEKIM